MFCESFLSILDAALVAADTSENLNEILDHIEEEEEQEEGPVGKDPFLFSFNAVILGNTATITVFQREDHLSFTRGESLTESLT